MIRAEHLPHEIGTKLRARASAGATSPGPEATVPVPLALIVDRFADSPSAEELRTVLEHYRGSVALTASFYGRDRKQVYRWLKRHRLDPGRFRDPSEP